MAQDMLAVMSALGEPQFDLIGHDRGARVAHRMALEAPDRLRSIAVLDILPTLDVWRLMDAELAKRYYHWGFLAQPGDMPQRLINADPVFYLRNALGALSGQIEMFHPEALSDYEAAARNPDVVRAWCGDYRAGATVDLDHDRADLGRHIDLPCLVLWGTRGVVDLHENPVTVWQNWFPRAQGQGIEAGHFLVEECPETVLPLLHQHLRGVTRG
jgi:haloacetate dehalogenase